LKREEGSVFKENNIHNMLVTFSGNDKTYGASRGVDVHQARCAFD